MGLRFTGISPDTNLGVEGLAFDSYKPSRYNDNFFNEF